MIRTLDWRLRQLHKNEGGWCTACGFSWPCATEQVVANYLADRKREQEIQAVPIHHMDIVWGADEEPTGRDGEIVYQSSVTHIPTRCTATGTGRSVLAAREAALRGLREAIAAVRTLTQESLPSFLAGDESLHRLTRRDVHSMTLREATEMVNALPKDPHRCPDGGKCHHGCSDQQHCWRVENAGPLSGYGEDWTETDLASHLPTDGGFGG